MLAYIFLQSPLSLIPLSSLCPLLRRSQRELSNAQAQLTADREDLRREREALERRADALQQVCWGVWMAWFLTQRKHSGGQVSRRALLVHAQLSTHHCSRRLRAVQV